MTLFCLIIQIANGLQITLAKQYFDDWLAPIRQRDCTFSRIEKKINSQQTHEGVVNY